MLQGASRNLYSLSLRSLYCYVISSETLEVWDLTSIRYVEMPPISLSDYVRRRLLVKELSSATSDGFSARRLSVIWQWMTARKLDPPSHMALIIANLRTVVYEFQPPVLPLSFLLGGFISIYIYH